MFFEPSLYVTKKTKKTNKTKNTKNPYVTDLSSYHSIKIQDNPYELQQKIQKNRELLLMMLKLQQVEESIWGRFLRFEKLKVFTDFEKKFRFKKVFRLRLDDIIYLILLAIIMIVFGILASNLSKYNSMAAQFVTDYRYMLVFLFIFSIIWLISSNGYRHWVFLFLCGVFPAITLLIYMGIIPFGEVDTTTIYQYLNILTLWIVYAALYVVYPIKQFVRNKIGSLYSYLHALSTITLFFIWPTYSLLEQLIKNQRITFSFITENRALIITFLCIVVFTFHLFTHHTFFQGKLKETKRILRIYFTQPELTRALQEVQMQEEAANQALQPLKKEETNNQTKGSKPKPKSEFQSFLYRNFTAYCRIMSLLVFAFTLAIQIYVFLYLVDNLDHIIRSLGVMIFCVGFLVYGCIINSVPLSRQATLYFFTLISLVPVAFSGLYCNTCPTSYSFTFYQYIFLATALPYATIFWCVVRSLSLRKPFLRTNILVTLYVFIHIPLTLFMINSLQMISKDQSTVILFNYIVLGIVGLVAIIGLVSFIGWLCLSVKELPVEQGENDKIVDYNYYEQGNPPYIPYTKKQSFSLAYLSSLDIRNLAQLFVSIIFICCELTTMYTFNLMNTTYANVALASPNAKLIIYSQFYISFAFYTYSFTYIWLNYKNSASIFILVALAALGLFGVIFSYIAKITIAYSFRVAGSASLILCVAGIALHVVKNRNKQIINFLSGVMMMLFWIILILPYAIALPITSLFIPISQYGYFIYGCILATTLLLIVLVSILSILFNILMNKFEEEKKAKFMTQDVEAYLREEGIETEDEVLHIFYESYEYRDQKYVYFMKRGYPIRLYKDSTDPDSNMKTILYNQDTINKSQQQKEDIKQDEKQKDYCWICLTCLCGVDDDELENKMNKVANKNIIDEDQMEELMPEDFLKHVFVRALKKKDVNERKYVDLSKLYSSKSIILRHLTHTNRHMGQEFAMLKAKKNRKLGIQIWHLIFDFLANEDDPPAKIIFNDFLIFCSLIDIPQLSKNSLNDLYLDFATAVWKHNTAIDINDFALIIQQLAQQKYLDFAPNADTKYFFLVEAVYPQLCQYAEFQDAVSERRVKKTKQNSIIGPGNQSTENKIGLNMFSMTDEELDSSPFVTSFEKHLKISQKLTQKRQKYNEKKVANWQNKLIQPAQQQIIEPKKKKQQQKPKQKSCKLLIYQKYQACKNCFRKIQQEQAVIKRKNIKPWQYLAVQAIRIMEHKQAEWKEKKKEKQYEFRLILNNLLIAVFKLVDLYTYMEITIMNPMIGWQSYRSFSILLIQYKIQLYISFAVVLICAGLGIKGIQYIFQDRLGLTQNRIPAVFPHPMFFFTFIYKLLILSLFNTIIMTLLSTFMCDWTSSTTTTYYMTLGSGNPQIQCFSSEHNIYMICSLVAIIIYYPLSAYTMPNFQFSEKRLDLQYKPSFQILYFQVNFVLAAGKVLLSQAVSTSTNTVQTIQVLFQSINIFCIGLLALCVIFMRPCLISWFNIIQFLVIWIGFVWNVFGLVLYLTKLWLLCIILGSAISLASIVISIIFIRRRFFGGVKIEAQANADEIGELEMAWKYKKQYNMDMVKFGADKSKDKQSIEYTDKQFEKNNILFDDLEPSLPPRKQNTANSNNKGKTNGQMNRPSNNLSHEQAATNVGSQKRIDTLLDLAFLPNR